jgi:hypothetical protein
MKGRRHTPEQAGLGLLAIVTVRTLGLGHWVEIEWLFMHVNCSISRAPARREYLGQLLWQGEAKPHEQEDRLTRICERDSLT